MKEETQIRSLSQADMHFSNVIIAQLTRAGDFIVGDIRQSGLYLLPKF
jgi:hypothetical protein